MLACRDKVGVVVLVEWIEEEADEAEREGGFADDDNGDEIVVAAADCARWRIAISEGLWRRSWLFDERWPGVWERGIGGA